MHMSRTIGRGVLWALTSVVRSQLKTFLMRLRSGWQSLGTSFEHCLCTFSPQSAKGQRSNGHENVTTVSADKQSPVNDNGGLNTWCVRVCVLFCLWRTTVRVTMICNLTGGNHACVNGVQMRVPAWHCEWRTFLNITIMMHTHVKWLGVILCETVPVNGCADCVSCANYCTKTLAWFMHACLFFCLPYQPIHHEHCL